MSSRRLGVRLVKRKNSPVSYESPRTLKARSWKSCSDLDDDCWCRILSFLPTTFHFSALPLVCRNFRQLLLRAEAFPSLIDLSHPHIKNSWARGALPYLGRIRSLTLKLRIVHIDEFSFLYQQMPRPKELGLSFSCMLTYRSCQSMWKKGANLPLSSLSLLCCLRHRGECEIIRDDLAWISPEELNLLGWNKIDVHALSTLKEMPKLNSLNFSNCDIRNGHLDAIKNLSIRRLNLWGNRRLSDRGLLALQDLPLEYLNLKNIPLTDACCINLAQIKTLKYLNIEGTKIQENGLWLLSRLPHLETLETDLFLNEEITNLFKKGVIHTS